MQSPEPYPRFWCVIQGAPGDADACDPSLQAHIHTRVPGGAGQPKDGEGPAETESSNLEGLSPIA